MYGVRLMYIKDMKSNGQVEEARRTLDLDERGKCVQKNIQ